MYGPYKLKVALGASVVGCVAVAYAFPALGYVALPLALSNGALLLCGDHFRHAKPETIRRARRICHVAAVLNVPLFFWVFWQAAVQSPYWLFGLMLPYIALMRVHEITLALNKLDIRRYLDNPVKAQIDRNSIPDHWAWVMLLIWGPLFFYGSLVFLRGEFAASSASCCVMAVVVVGGMLYMGRRIFRQLRDRSISLARSTWLGIAGWGFIIVLSPAFFLLPALYGGVYIAHKAVASTYTGVQPAVKGGKGFISRPDMQVGLMNFCFQPQHKNGDRDVLAVAISRSSLGMAAEAYEIDGIRFENYCSPRWLFM